MTPRDLHEMLDPIADTREVVLRRAVPGDGLPAVWRAAAQDARSAYAEWCAAPGPATRAAHLAAEDQADAAVASLRAAAPSRALA